MTKRLMALAMVLVLALSLLSVAAVADGLKEGLPGSTAAEDEEPGTTAAEADSEQKDQPDADAGEPSGDGETVQADGQKTAEEDAGLQEEEEPDPAGDDPDGDETPDDTKNSGTEPSQQAGEPEAGDSPSSEDGAEDDMGVLLQGNGVSEEEDEPDDSMAGLLGTGEPMPLAVTKEGDFGEGNALHWSFDDATGVLTISGTGAMPDYDDENPTPWDDQINAITRVVIEADVTSIGAVAFMGCENLSNVTIPESVTSIGDGAFSVCTALTNVTIPNSVTSIGKRAFSQCENLRNVTIPESVTSIGDEAFSNCFALTNITIPNSVTSIGEYAFSWCSGLTSVSIPSSVSTIQYATFWNCSSLTSVSIPSSVKTIDEAAFLDTGLTSLDIPASVTSVGERAFANCPLTSVLVPQTVSSIGDHAFGYEFILDEAMAYEGFLIYGYGGSQAETYAKTNSMKFVEIKGYDEEDGYEFVVDPEASDTTYTLDSGENVTIHCSGELANFVRLLVDGVEVDPSNYTRSEGSTVLVLDHGYLDTLDVGDHPADMEYTNGYAEAVITILPHATPTPKPTQRPASNSGGTKINTVSCYASVVDPEGAPVANLTLELHSAPKTATTDQVGNAAFGSVEFGTHTFYVADNRSVSLTFQFVPGNSTYLSGNTVTAVRGSSVRLTLQYDGTSLKLLSASSGVPATGDGNDIQLWAGLLVLSMAGCAIVAVKRKKTQH